MQMPNRSGTRKTRRITPGRPRSRHREGCGEDTVSGIVSGYPVYRIRGDRVGDINSGNGYTGFESGQKTTTQLHEVRLGSRHAAE